MVLIFESRPGDAPIMYKTNLDEAKIVQLGMEVWLVFILRDLSLSGVTFIP